jgi:hypothetical protein
MAVVGADAIRLHAAAALLKPDAAAAEDQARRVESAGSRTDGIAGCPELAEAIRELAHAVALGMRDSAGAISGMCTVTAVEGDGFGRLSGDTA